MGYLVVCLDWMAFEMGGKGCGRIGKIVEGLGLHMSLISCVFDELGDNGSHGSVCRSFCILGR